MAIETVDICHEQTPQLEKHLEAEHQPKNNQSETNDCDSGNATLPGSSHSNNVSIKSLYSSDSSLADSDSDFEDSLPIDPDVLLNNIRQINNNDSSATSGIIIQNQCQSLENELRPSDQIAKPQIGSIAVQNSSDITFGNKTFYQGPVTIKQFLLENNKWKLKSENGVANEGYDKSNDNVNTDTNKSPNDQCDTVRKQRKSFVQFLRSSKLLVVILALIMVLLIALAVLISTSNYFSNDYDNSVNGPSLRFISRLQWVAQPPNGELDNLELPAQRVIIAHTATENCSSQAACVYHVRYIQTFHIESQGWNDIAYNFLVGGDGSAYEGRGWDKEGAHTKGFNKRSICIAFIGLFNTVKPPQQQIRAALLLMDEGVKQKKLTPDYKIYAHRQLIPFESPGLALFNIIKTWPHWSNDTSSFR